MSLPGVESARWRRASHGRSSAAPIYRASTSNRSCRYRGYAATRQAAMVARNHCDRTECNVNVRAVLARDRLHEKLWGPNINAADRQRHPRPGTAGVERPLVSSAPGKQSDSRGFPFFSVLTLICNKHL